MCKIHTSTEYVISSLKTLKTIIYTYRYAQPTLKLFQNDQPSQPIPKQKRQNRNNLTDFSPQILEALP